MKTIDAGELRIGNYLYGVIAPRIVKSITKDYYTDEYDNSTLIRDAKPIPLTEDILLKWCKAIQVKPIKGIQKAFKLGSIRINMSNSGNFYYKKNVYNTLHQIQNLYYAIEQEELQINFDM